MLRSELEACRSDEPRGTRPFLPSRCADTRVRNMSPARILILGSGGREHALAWRLARDPEAPEILVAPGNEGVAASFRRIDLDPADAPRVIDACRRESIDLVVVGPRARSRRGSPIGWTSTTSPCSARRVRPRASSRARRSRRRCCGRRRRRPREPACSKAWRPRAAGSPTPSRRGCSRSTGWRPARACS